MTNCPICSARAKREGYGDPLPSDAKMIFYGGKRMELNFILVEDKNEKWDDDLAQEFCNAGGCVIHKGNRHLVYTEISDEALDEPKVK